MSTLVLPSWRFWSKDNYRSPFIFKFNVTRVNKKNHPKVVWLLRAYLNHRHKDFQLPC